MEDNNSITITHPVHGHVIFNGLSVKQLDILQDFEKLVELQADYPNDQEFGNIVRPIFIRKPKDT